MIINEGTLRYFFAVAFTYDSSEIIDSFKWNDSVPVSHKWNHKLISIYKILQNILALFNTLIKALINTLSIGQPVDSHISKVLSNTIFTDGKWQTHECKNTKLVENYSKRKIVEMRFSVIITLRKAAFVSTKTPHGEPQFRTPKNSRAKPPNKLGYF